MVIRGLPMTAIRGPGGGDRGGDPDRGQAVGVAASEAAGVDQLRMIPSTVTGSYSANMPREPWAGSTSILHHLR
jgi:hypothetical protein